MRRPLVRVFRRDAAWNDALADHRAALTGYLAKANRVADGDWNATQPGRAWSVAEETLHLVKAYELPMSESGMRLRVSPAFSWFLRTFYLRWLSWRGRFHYGARAPSEVRPDADQAREIPRTELIQRLERTADEAATYLRHAAETGSRRGIVHAYFGPLQPLAALRFLSAHTRHHTTL